MIFLVFFALVFTRVPSEGNEVQMSQNMQKKDAEITFLTIILKLRNCVSTAPARADRESRLPETVNKLTKKDMRTKTPHAHDFL